MTVNDGRIFEFALDVEVFTTCSSGDHMNSVEKLQELKGIMVRNQPGLENPAYLTLESSPVNTVTLPAPARASANIPTDAAFYSFCYPYNFNLKDGEDLEKILLEKDIDVFDPFVAWVSCTLLRDFLRQCGGGSPEAQTRLPIPGALKLHVLLSIKRTGSQYLLTLSLFSQLVFGGYVYLDSTYDIVAVNAFSTNEEEAKSKIFFGVPCEICPTTLARVRDMNRFRRVGHFGVRKLGQGFEEFAWITPSEMIDTTIFTRSGGFIYKVVHGSTLPMGVSYRWGTDAYLQAKLAGQRPSLSTHACDLNSIQLFWCSQVEGFSVGDLRLGISPFI